MMDHTGYPNEIDDTLNSIDLYVTDGLPPGDFLRACLVNDLHESFARADDTNRRYMFDIVRYMHNEIPVISHGSIDRYESWIYRGGRNGMSAK